MTRVQLPAGCVGLDMANGKKYNAERAGGSVDVSAADAKYINTSWYGPGQAGIMRGAPSFVIGTRNGRWCTPCKRLWQAWSEVCPKCGEATIVEYASAPNGVPGPGLEGQEPEGKSGANTTILALQED
jgi:hypothetical protein